MKIVQGDRQTGKTTQLVEWAKEDPARLILVHVWREAHRIVEEFELPSHQVAPWGAQQRFDGSPHREIGIDNLDLMIMERTPWVPAIATITWPIEFVRRLGDGQ